MPTIDADAHVIESDETWRYIPNEKLRPFLISPGAGRPQNWLIDGRVFNRGVNFDRNLPVDICEMRDIKSRLKHMDQLDIDVPGVVSVAVSAAAHGKSRSRERDLPQLQPVVDRCLCPGRRPA